MTEDGEPRRDHSRSLFWAYSPNVTTEADTDFGEFEESAIGPRKSKDKSFRADAEKEALTKNRSATVRERSCTVVAREAILKKSRGDFLTSFAGTTSKPKSFVGKIEKASEKHSSNKSVSESSTGGRNSILSSLDDYDLSAEQAEEFASRFRITVDPTSNRFILRNRKLFGEVSTLFKVLKSCNVLYQLQYLTLSSCYLRLEGITVVCSDCIPKCPNLKKLDLSFNSMGVKGILAVAQALKSHAHITELNLRGNCGQISEMNQRAPVITYVAGTANGILSLDLSRNNVQGAERLLLLLDSLINPKKLRDLKLGDNSIDDESSRMLFLQSIQHCSQLTKLDLSCNSISNLDCASMVLKRKTCTIQQLDLSGNPIEDASFATLLHSLEVNESLRVLKLDRTLITSENGWSLLAFWRGKRRLQRLSFAYTPLSSESSISEVTDDVIDLFDFFYTLRTKEGHQVEHSERFLSRTKCLVDTQLWGETPPGVAYACGHAFVGHYLAKRRARPRQRDWKMIIKSSVGLVILLFDVGSDIGVTVKYFFEIDTRIFGCIALVALLVSDLAVLAAVYYSSRASGKQQIFKAMPSWKWKLIPIFPVFEIVSHYRSIKEANNIQSKQYQSDLEGLGLALTFAESVFESTPLLCIQAYVFSKTAKSLDIFNQNQLLETVSLMFSLLSIVKSMIMYIKLRKKRTSSNWVGIRTVKSRKEAEPRVSEEDSELVAIPAERPRRQSVRGLRQPLLPNDAL